MPLPQNTATVLVALGYDALSDFTCTDRNGTITIDEWNHGDPQPTEQQINDYASDVTNLPSGQTFTQWQAENGGDPALTLRRQAKEALDETSRETNALIRALALTVLGEINLLRAQHSLAARTPTQLRNAIKQKLTDGEADN